jgi:hypothetical protein
MSGFLTSLKDTVTRLSKVDLSDFAAYEVTAESPDEAAALTEALALALEEEGCTAGQVLLGQRVFVIVKQKEWKAGAIS